MKAVLFLCLLAFMTCEKDIIDIGKCIYKAPLVKELINDVIVAIATKDYSKLLPKIKESIPELIQIVLGCLVDAKEDQQKLDLPFIPEDCLRRCRESFFGLIDCVKILCHLYIDLRIK